MIRRLLRAGVPVYAFLPIKKFNDNFRLTAEGPLYRVTFDRRRPGSPLRPHGRRGGS